MWFRAKQYEEIIKENKAHRRHQVEERRYEEYCQSLERDRQYYAGMKVRRCSSCAAVVVVVVVPVVVTVVYCCCCDCCCCCWLLLLLWVVVAVTCCCYCWFCCSCCYRCRCCYFSHPGHTCAPQTQHDSAVSTEVERYGDLRRARAEAEHCAAVEFCGGGGGATEHSRHEDHRV